MITLLIFLFRQMPNKTYLLKLSVLTVDIIQTERLSCKNSVYKIIQSNLPLSLKYERFQNSPSTIKSCTTDFFVQTKCNNELQ